MAAVTATADTPTNVTANCDGTVVRTVAVSVTVSRSGVGPENPQFWQAGVRVRATVFETVRQRAITLSPGNREIVTIPFTRVEDRSRAPSGRVDVVVQATKGASQLAKRNLTATFRPVAAGENC